MRTLSRGRMTSFFGLAECADPLFAPLKGVLPIDTQHAHRTTTGGLTDLIASRIPPTRDQV